MYTSESEACPLGAVVWLVKMGCHVPLKALQAAIDELENETPETFGYGDTEGRKKEVAQEIELLRSAEKNGGHVEPIGAKCIQDSFLAQGLTMA